eukprot:GSChrysophyteH2.ASY1.ANO1.1497.1 assembled CDS
MSSSWCTIESDPGVFTELIEGLGVKDTSVSEIYSFDMAEEWQKQGCQGFIYLFKYKREEDPRPVVDAPEGMFFARQIVQDACATQALLSVLMNADVELGEMLSDFKGFAGVLDSESMGITIGNHDGIRSVHNSFSRPEPFVMDDEDKKRNKGKEQDVFHFVAYVPFEGVLYEVDGLKPGPIHLGEIGTGQAWWDVARPAIEARMEAANDIKSVLLAVGRSRMASLTEQLAALGNTEAEENQKVELQALINDEQDVRQRNKAENILRRHNFFPMILQMTAALGRRGQLAGLVTAAKEKKAEAYRARVAASKEETTVSASTAKE